MLHEKSLSRNTKKPKTEKDNVSLANTKELCKNCLVELKQLRGWLQTYNSGGFTQSQLSLDTVKDALIEKVCVLGARLCYVRDSQDLIMDAGLEISQTVMSGINDIIYYRNQFRKTQIYKSVEQRNDFFLSLLGLKSHDDNTINLDEIVSFLNKLKELEDVENLKNKLTQKEPETKETKEENEQPPGVVQRKIDTITALKVAKEYALKIEKTKNLEDELVKMASRRCVMCMFQAYLDYKDSYGSSGGEKKRKKATEEGSKDKITPNDLVLLQGTHQSRRLMAHISDKAIDENEIAVFLKAHFSDYFEILLQNAIKFSQQNSSNKASSVSEVQANHLQGLEKELTSSKKPEENVKKTVDVPVEVQQFENYKTPNPAKVEEASKKTSQKNDL